MAHQHGEAWLSPRVPFKQGIECSLEAGDEKVFDFRNSPPLPNSLLRSNREVRLAALLERVLS
jgi:hypothetical protein